MRTLSILSRHGLPGSLRLKLGLLLSFTVCLVGCNDAPFDIVPVTGKVTYEDGSPIPGDRIIVTFIPQDVEAKEKLAPKAASGSASPEDGTFEGLTTHKHNDGAIIGHHKVTVMSLEMAEFGGEVPTAAVPPIYHNKKTTPLEVDVTSGGDHFELKIEKPH